jgi:hypothetical protein
MFDSVIITLRTKDRAFISNDIDIPCKEPLKDLKIKLLEILCIFDNRLFSGWQDIRFFNEKTNKELDPEESLEEAEIWDGNILVITN